MYLKQHIISAIKEDNIPMAFCLYGQAMSDFWGYANGTISQGTNLPLTIDTPFRIASNTKTFTAATILRLWEEGKIELDAAINNYIDCKLIDILENASYNTSQITVRHLLNHSSSLSDHADRDYIIQILKNPQHKWTIEEQLLKAVNNPLKSRQVGQNYSYSDTGYILLGNIIECVTNQSLGVAVREYLKFNQLGLRSTWWERIEPVPVGTKPRAHQYIGKYDTTLFDPSMDCFGGGGLIMSSRDLALWMAMLFEGKIYNNSQTLNEMKSMGKHQNADQYRLGLMYEDHGDYQIYYHTGFWGSAAFYCPEKKISIAGFTPICEKRPQLLNIFHEIIKQY